MFRRSVATTILERPNLRYVDAIIGFSDMKVSVRSILFKLFLKYIIKYLEPCSC